MNKYVAIRITDDSTTNLLIIFIVYSFEHSFPPCVSL